MATHPADMDHKLLKGLWALHLTANRRKHIQPLLPIHITNAALPQALTNPTGRSVVKLTSTSDHAGVGSSIPDGFILVSLVGGRAEQAPLDFHLEGKRSYTIEVIGDNDIFLAGNVIGTTTFPSTHSQLVQSNSDSINETEPQTQPVQQTLEKRDTLPTVYNSSTSSITSTSSETSNVTVVPIKANIKGLDKIDFSRLTFIDIKKGTGQVAELSNRVSVYYDVIIAQTETYVVQWAPGDNRPPHQFDVGSRSVVKGFNQGIIGMREGGVREIYVPCNLAYGEKGVSKVPPNSDLVIRCALYKVDPADF